MSETIQLTLEETGDILIPPSLRERLNLSQGTTLVVENDEKGAARLRVQSKGVELIMEGGILVARCAVLSDISDVARNERDRRLFALLQRVGL